MGISLYDVIESELMKKGLNEFVNDQGELVFFEDHSAFMTKIFNYDEDVSNIMVHLFNGISLTMREHDEHFKKNFLYRFINREINRQTIEAFKLELMSTFLSHQEYINRLYNDLEQYVTNTSTGESENENTGSSSSTSSNKQDTQANNESLTDGEVISNNRNASQNLPQSQINIDLNNDNLSGAATNDIQKNKQENQSTQNSNSTSETTATTENESNDESSALATSLNKTYQLDTLFKTMGVLDYVLDDFDRRCFKQTW